MAMLPMIFLACLAVNNLLVPLPMFQATALTYCSLTFLDLLMLIVVLRLVAQITPTLMDVVDRRVPSKTIKMRSTDKPFCLT